MNNIKIGVIFLLIDLGDIMTKLSQNIDNEPEELNDEELEVVAKKKIKIAWIVALAVFAVCFVGTFIFLSLKNKKTDNPLDHIKLGQYKGLTYSSQDLIVTDVDIKKEIDRLADNKSTYEELSDRFGSQVLEDDIVFCNYVARLDGEVLEEGSGYFELGSGYVAACESALLGKVVRDTFVINAKVPENYIDEKLAELVGEKVEFEVLINHIAAKNAPTVDDAFAVSVSNGDIESVSELNGYIREKLTKGKEEAAHAAIESELLKKVIDDSKFTDIDGMVEEYYTTIHKTYEDIAVAYNFSFEEYIRKFYQTDVASFEAQLRDTMTDLVKEQLVLKAIADKEKIAIEAGSDQYKKYMEKYLLEYEYDDEKTFLENYGEESVKESMLYDAAIDLVIEAAVAE